MANFNQVVLMGNVTRNPQMKYLPSQTAVCEFGLATNRKFKTAGSAEEREEVCFVDCTAFGKQAEVLNLYAQKGKPLFIQGRLKYDAWDDKAGGGKRSKLTVVVENFQFIGGRDGAGSFVGAAAESERRGGSGAGGPSTAEQRGWRGGTGNASRGTRGDATADATKTATDAEKYEQADIPF